MIDSMETKLEILHSRIGETWEWTIVILVAFIGAAIFWTLCGLLQKMIDLFMEGLKVMFGKMKKPKFKELDFSKRKQQDNYPVEVYLNNAMWYLLGDLVDPERGYNVEAISELRYAMMKGHYEIRPDVMLKLSAHFPDWHFPEEEQ